MLKHGSKWLGNGSILRLNCLAVGLYVPGSKWAVFGDIPWRRKMSVLVYYHAMTPPPPTRATTAWVAPNRIFFNFFYFSLEVWFFPITFACKSRFLMVNLEKFRENARKEGICDRYAVLWDGCGSKKGLMDLALSAQGADFLCDGIAKGWGISADEIVRRFGRYINGVYTYEDASGYSSVMYCKYYGEIVVDDTLLVLIDCDTTVFVPDWGVVDIYATGFTNLSVVGGGRVRLIAYGDKGDVTVESVDEACRFKRIQKLSWSRGDS